MIYMLSASLIIMSIGLNGAGSKTAALGALIVLGLAMVHTHLKDKK